MKHLSVNLAVWASAVEKPQKYLTWNTVKLCYMALFTCVTCLQLCLRTTFLQSFPKCTVYLVRKNGTRPFLLPASTFVIIKREVRIDVSSHLTHFSGQPEQKLSLWRNGTHTTITTTNFKMWIWKSHFKIKTVFMVTHNKFNTSCPVTRSGDKQCIIRLQRLHISISFFFSNLLQ